MSLQLNESEQIVAKESPVQAVELMGSRFTVSENRPVQENGTTLVEAQPTKATQPLEVTMNTVDKPIDIASDVVSPNPVSNAEEGSIPKATAEPEKPRLIIRFKAPPLGVTTSTVSPVSSVGLDDEDDVPRDTTDGDKKVVEEPVKRKRKSSSTSNKTSYLTMIKGSLDVMKEKNGASLVAIRNHVLKAHKPTTTTARFNQYFSSTLKKGVADGVIIRTGARYKLSDKAKIDIRNDKRKKFKSVGIRGLKSLEALEALNNAELNMSDSKIRKRQLERMRKEREILEYKAALALPPVTR